MNKLEEAIKTQFESVTNAALAHFETFKRRIREQEAEIVALKQQLAFRDHQLAVYQGIIDKSANAQQLLLDVERRSAAEAAKIDRALLF